MKRNGSMTELAELRAFIKQAKKGGQDRFYLVWFPRSMTPGGKHAFLTTCIINQKTVLRNEFIDMIDHDWRGPTETLEVHSPGNLAANLTGVFKPKPSAWLFTNWWLAYAHHQRGLAKLARSKARRKPK